MQSIITRNYINSLEVKEENQLCNCKCNLDVFRELSKEKEKKLDDLDKKFMPYIFESKIMILYCKDCDSLYLMKSHYEASSKIDFENVDFILKKDYFKANDYIKRLEKRYRTDDSYTLYVDKYYVRVLKNINNEKFSMKYISIEDTVKEYDYIKNKEICYNCDNKYTVKNGLVECSKNKQIYEVNHTCNNFDSIYKYFDDEEGEE